MAEAEERHADRRAARLREAGQEPGVFRESFAERLRRNILLKSDTGVAAKMLEAAEGEADGLYEQLIRSADDPAVTYVIGVLLSPMVG